MHNCMNKSVTSRNGIITLGILPRAGECGEETDDISDYLQCVRVPGTPLPSSASLFCPGLSKRPWPLSLSCTTYLSAFLPVPFVNIRQFVLLFVASVSIQIYRPQGRLLATNMSTLHLPSCCCIFPASFAQIPPAP